MPSKQGGEDGEYKSLAERLRETREKIQRKEKATRARRRASARRVEREEPETARERVAIQKNRVMETKDELTGLATDTKELTTTVVGNNRGGKMDDESDTIVERIGSALDNVDTREFAKPMDDQDGLGSASPSKATRMAEQRDDGMGALDPVDNDVGDVEVFDPFEDEL